MNYRVISGLSTGAVLITVGAILYFAVTANVSGFDVNAAGAILMIVGFGVGLVALVWGMTDEMRSRSYVVRTRPVAPAVPTVIYERHEPAHQEPEQVVVAESRRIETRP